MALTNILKANDQLGPSPQISVKPREHEDLNSLSYG